MESHVVPFKEMLTPDFSYQVALFCTDANVDKILSAGYWKSEKKKKNLINPDQKLRTFHLCPSHIKKYNHDCCLIPFFTPTVLFEITISVPYSKKKK